MKKLVFVLLLAASALGFAQPKTNYEIHGKLNSVEAGMIYMLHGRGAYIQVIDSARVINQQYSLKGFVEVAQQSMLMTYNFKTTKSIRPDGLVPIFLSPGEYHITHNQNFRTMKITGSKGYNDYQALLALAKPFEDQNIALKSEIYQLLMQRDTVGANDANARQYTLEHDFREKVYGGFIKQHPTSPVAFYALKQFAGNEHTIDGQRLKPYYDLLPKGIKGSEDGKEFGKRINDAIVFDTKGAIGNQAQEFTLLDTAGNAVKLSDYKGKYVLVDFWASWCSPCRADNPHLVAAYQQFHKKGFEILSVSLDTKIRVRAWRNAIDHDHLTAWKHVADLEHDINSVVTLYGISGIPQNFLIDPNGKIIGRSLRGGDLEKKLSEVIN